MLCHDLTPSLKGRWRSSRSPVVLLITSGQPHSLSTSPSNPHFFLHGQPSLYQALPS